MIRGILYFLSCLFVCLWSTITFFITFLSMIIRNFIFVMFMYTQIMTNCTKASDLNLDYDFDTKNDNCSNLH